MKKTWYKIVSSANETEIKIFNEIGYWGVTYEEFIAELDAINNNIKLRINSPGGSVFEGLAIYDALERHKAKGYEVNVYIEGTAASMSSVIAMVGNEITISENGRFMIHEAAGMAFGTAKQIRDTADLIETEQDKLVNIYKVKNRKEKTLDEINDWLVAETWFHGADAVANGFADKTSEPLKIAASWDWEEITSKYNFKNVPDSDNNSNSILDAVKNITKEVVEEVKKFVSNKNKVMNKEQALAKLISEVELTSEERKEIHEILNKEAEVIQAEVTDEMKAEILKPVQESIQAIEAKFELKEGETVENKIDELKSEIETLTTEKASLQATIDGTTIIPKNEGDNIDGDKKEHPFDKVADEMKKEVSF